MLWRKKKFGRNAMEDLNLHILTHRFRGLLSPVTKWGIYFINVLQLFKSLKLSNTLAIKNLK